MLHVLCKLPVKNHLYLYFACLLGANEQKISPMFNSPFIFLKASQDFDEKHDCAVHSPLFVGFC